MEAVQKDSWYSLALLTFLVFLKATLQERGEHVTLADGMILDCLCPWNGNLSMVSWTKVPDKSAMAIYHPIYGTDFAPKYLDRLTFLRRTTMDGSVSFGNVTEQDAGLYRCSMQTFPLGTWTRDVQVIKENLSPYVELDFREGSNLTLVCPHHNYTVKHVLIKKDENETIGRCAMQGGALVSEDLHEGVQVNCADLVEGVSFELNNVAEADQGLYQCLLTTENGVEITTYLLTVRNQDAPYPPPNHPEEAAVSPTLTQAQVLEDPDPAEGTAITELPSSDAENGVPNSSAPTERMLTTDSVSSDTTNSVHHPSAPTEEIPTTDTVPPAIGTTMLHLPDPAVTEDLYSTKLAPAVIATTAIHLPEACREPVVVGPCRGAFPRFYYNATTHSCQTFLFGGCRDKANNFLSREECESTCRGGAAPSEELSTTEPAPSLVDTTMLPSRAPPEEELTPESLPPVPATTVRLPPDPTEETTTTEQPPPTKTTTASPASDWPFWSWVDIPDQYWIFIYAGAGAVGLLILILTIVLVIVCRRRRRREAYRVRMHPGKRWRDSEQGGFYDRMRKGTRFGRQEPVYANVRTGPKHKHKPKQKRRQ